MNLEREGRILVTGAGEPLGEQLVRHLVARYGEDRIIATDNDTYTQESVPYCCFEAIDILNTEHLERIIKENKVVQIYHMAAIPSLRDQGPPLESWNVLDNLKGLSNILELTRIHGLERVFWPSSFAVFGSNALKKNTPQSAVTEPDTVYGISKVAGELKCQFYFKYYGVDVRSLRYPGLIGHSLMGRRGITDYVVDAFHKAANNQAFECYLNPDKRLPMIYMPDAVKAAMDLMHAPLKGIGVRTSYNLNAMSFTPAELHQSIKRFFPDFEMLYKPDFRQDIADTWPERLDDGIAQKNWGWQSEYTLDLMVQEIFGKL